ncbi:MAG TPA: tetratricopeptide repeat protein [Pyrinomonadaceae bacterium]|nr:tetratricopeptide repeat protein [Pyrinomonadaceae bacterium]
MPTPIHHYCQRCLAANPLGQDFCARCGTRLMIVVEPSSSRFALGEGSVSTGEHLLERISALENRTSRLTERLERGLDLLLRQAQNSYFDRSLVKALISLLADDGVVENERLEKLWSDRCQKDAVEQEESVQRDVLRLRILSGFDGADRQAFEDLINEGFLLIESKQLERGVEILQKATPLSPDNLSLFLFIGEHFFRTGKTKQAREHLTRAYEASPEDGRLSLLLGLTCADEGDLQMARELLNLATVRGGSSFAGHYGLGRLFVAENDWSNALREFKRALTSKPSPEAHYVLACLYYQLCRDTLAKRHLKKAIEMDGNYREALHLLSLISQRKGQNVSVEDTQPKTRTGTVAAKETAVRRKMVAPGAVVAPLFQLQSKRLMTGTDQRLAKALREDALKAFPIRGTDN